MYKFFVSTNQIQNKCVKIIGEDVNHISNVLRLHELEKIIVCDKDTKTSFCAQIIHISAKQVDCKILDENIETTESRYFGYDELPMLAEEKNNKEQIKMCFDAYHDKNWKTLLD